LRFRGALIYWFFIAMNLAGFQALSVNLCEYAFVPHSLDAYQTFQKIKDHKYSVDNQLTTEGKILNSYGSPMPIVRSLEKEGLLYSDIAAWFNQVKPEAHQKLRNKFDHEIKNRKGRLFNWLQDLELRSEVQPNNWGQRTPYQKLMFLLKQENFFDLIEVQKIEELFDAEILSFDDLLPSDRAPKSVRVMDDLGSYEVLLDLGLADRTEYLKLKSKIETYLEGRIGHQHKFHGWPTDRAERERIGPKYIELLDATTWFLFWRQMKRDPTEIDSILFHPYLGVYTRQSLKRLYQAFVENKVEAFEDMHRMIGARNFKAHPDIPEQGSGSVPDWEIRSGNKGPKEPLIDMMIEAHLVSGDYARLRDFRDNQFDPSTPLEKLFEGMLSESELKPLKQFEEQFKEMKFSTHGNSDNHYRNRILSPFFNWESRFDLSYKKGLMFTARKEYAYALKAIAEKYLSSVKKQIPANQLRAATMARIEKALFDFSAKVRLDIDFENYLIPSPKNLPSIRVAETGQIPINQIALGVEYSLRFTSGFEPRSQSQAQAMIFRYATQLSEAIGGTAPELIEKGGHGHNIIVKYQFKDSQGKTWRVEWDGIQRTYKNGKPLRAWGGHVEVPTPKIVPYEFDDALKQVFVTGRKLNMRPRRSAGGAHMNMDIKKIKELLPPKQGARAIVNMINYFESNQQLILFMWQHPFRSHASTPVKLTKTLIEKLNQFQGDWMELAKLLYQEKYFNVYVGRKPKYVPLNVTALMTEIIPDQYMEKTLDIKNPKQKWFPNFNRVTDRIEARFFDAPEDEFMAALQIKWWRAFMNKGLNASAPILLQPKFSGLDVYNWKRNPEKWFQAAEAHLRDLGLDPAEFRPLLWSSVQNQQKHQVKKQNHKPYEDFEILD
jgi:hypothetical protein